MQNKRHFCSCTNSFSISVTPTQGAIRGRRSVASQRSRFPPRFCRLTLLWRGEQECSLSCISSPHSPPGKTPGGASGAEWIRARWDRARPTSKPRAHPMMRSCPRMLTSSGRGVCATPGALSCTSAAVGASASGRARQVSVCDVALARDDWGRRISSPVMDHSRPISSALTWLRRLLRTEGVKLREQHTSS
jgi:hypothetical protein